MRELTFQDSVFIRINIQRSINLPQSPCSKKQRKVLLSSETVQKLKEFVPSIKSSTISQNQFNKWMYKKQQSVKTYFDKKHKEQQKQDYQIRMSDHIKFRTQQDWIELKKLKSQRNQYVEQSKIVSSELSSKKSKVKMNKIQLINNKFEQKSENNNKILRLSHNQNYSIIKHKKINDKIDYEQKQTSLTQEKIKEAYVSGNYDNLIKMTNKSESTIIRNSPNRYLKQKSYNGSSKQSINLNFVKNYTNNKTLKNYYHHNDQKREISPQNQLLLKAKYSELDKRLDNILLLSRERKMTC